MGRDANPLKEIIISPSPPSSPGGALVNVYDRSIQEAGIQTSSPQRNNNIPLSSRSSRSWLSRTGCLIYGPLAVYYRTLLVPDNIDPPKPDNRIGYQALHMAWLIGLTVTMLIGLFYAYVYLINYGALAGTGGLDGTGQTSKISNNFEGNYYPGVLGQLRMARTEGQAGRDAVIGQDR